MKNFEYDIIEIEFANNKELKDQINEFGLKGWEICGETKPATSLLYLGRKAFIVKREMP